MRLNDGKYLCLFCLSSWHCEGPHIEEKDVESLYKRLTYMREDFALVAVEEIERFESSEKINLLALKQSVFDKITKRTIN